MRHVTFNPPLVGMIVETVWSYSNGYPNETFNPPLVGMIVETLGSSNLVRLYLVPFNPPLVGMIVETEVTKFLYPKLNHLSTHP